MAGYLSCIEIQTKYHKNDLNCFEYGMVIDATWAGLCFEETADLLDFSCTTMPNI